MEELRVELRSLAAHLRARREAILQSWRTVVDKDPSLTAGDALPRAELYDHIPALLSTFEQQLRNSPEDEPEPEDRAAHKYAAAHGLQRWQQGYDLREVTRELGKLNETVICELDSYTIANPRMSHAAIASARRLWAALCSTGIEESVGQYFHLQQQEAAGHVKVLESALTEIRGLEQQRADLWRQAAHDLRGNLGVVANATVGLTHRDLGEASRDEFVRILMRNVTSLHHLLDDVTSLARLQAGRETRCIESLDVTPILNDLCEGIRPLAQQQRLFLRSIGPPGFAADGDAVKIRRIAQNLVLNAVKYTREGGITVSWGDCGVHDEKRWQLCIKDTGPGFHASPSTAAGRVEDGSGENGSGENGSPMREAVGEGIGLSIVKRLCDMLDATIELNSEVNVGTTITILFPRHYAAQNT